MTPPTTAEIHSMAGQVRTALTQLGFAYQTKEGRLVEVTFRNLQRAGDRYALLEIDPHRLPPKVRIPDLESQAVLTHLSAVLGRPVRVLNSVGLTYAVVLAPAPKLPPLPVQALLPDRPGDVPYAWPVGLNRAGQAVWQSLERTGHILLTGATGAGKSTALNVALVSLFEQHGPDELQALLIDPKAVELAGYAGLPHLPLPIATTAEVAARGVAWLGAEIDRRQALMAGVAKDLAGYNRKAAERLPRLLVIIDEVVSLVMGWGGVRSEPWRALVAATVKARALGVSLVFAGQSARADVLDLVREQCGLKLALRLDTPHASRAAIGQAGAELLPHKTPGRLLAVGLTTASPPEMLQGFWLPEAELDARLALVVAHQPCPLTDHERALVAYAMQHLGGAFKIQVIYEALKGSQWHWSWRQLQQLARGWELRGWLTPQADAVTPRRVAPELARLAGQDPTGDKAL
ncbi:MAG: FtsK/SpoIIIE domain-containing protein [Anaerolineae bacterium]